MKKMTTAREQINTEFSGAANTNRLQTVREAENNDTHVSNPSISPEIVIPASTKESERAIIQEFFTAMSETFGGQTVGSLGQFLYFTDKWQKLIKSKSYKPHYEKDAELVKYTASSSEFTESLPELGALLVDIGTDIDSFDQKTIHIANAIQNSEDCELSGVSAISNNFDEVSDTAFHLSRNVFHHGVTISASTTDITSEGSIQVYKSQKHKSDANVPIITILGGTLLNMPESTENPEDSAVENILNVLNNIKQGFGTGSHLLISFDARTDIESLKETYKETKPYNNFIMSFFEHAQNLGIVNKNYKPESHWNVVSDFQETGPDKTEVTVYIESSDDHSFEIKNPTTGEVLKANISKGDRIPVIKSRKWGYDTLAELFTEKAGMKIVSTHPDKDSDYFLMHLRASKNGNGNGIKPNNH